MIDYLRDMWDDGFGRMAIVMAVLTIVGIVGFVMFVVETWG